MIATNKLISFHLVDNLIIIEDDDDDQNDDELKI